LRFSFSEIPEDVLNSEEFRVFSEAVIIVGDTLGNRYSSLD